MNPIEPPPQMQQQDQEPEPRPIKQAEKEKDTTTFLTAMGGQMEEEDEEMQNEDFWNQDNQAQN